METRKGHGSTPVRRVPLDEVSSQLVAGDQVIHPPRTPRMPALDVRDVLAFGGLFLLGTGIWWILPAASLIVVGGLLFILGVRGV